MLDGRGIANTLMKNGVNDKVWEKKCLGFEREIEGEPGPKTVKNDMFDGL